MKTPPTFIGTNILFNSCSTIVSELPPDNIEPAMLVTADIAELYIVDMDDKKQPINPSSEDAAIIIENFFSRDCPINSTAI